jgi:AcrR family transcriptional regulator
MSPAPTVKAEKRDRILAAAKAVFARKGFAGAAISDIAARADIGKGTVYEYYRSKEDLFFAVFEWFIEQGAAAVKVDISVLGQSAGDRLVALSESVVNQWGQLKDEFTLVMEFWAASSSSRSRDRFRQAFRNLYGRYRAIVVALLREGMARGEFRSDLATASIAAALVGAWDAMFLQAWFDDEFDLQQVSRDFIHVMVRGLRTD